MKLVFDKNILASADDDVLIHKNCILEFSSYDPYDNEDGKPGVNLAISIKHENISLIDINIETANQIDALRRYCEMVLEHHEKDLVEYHKNSEID